MNTAQVILSQIKSLDPKALFAWGAKELVNTGSGLKFKSSGMTRWKGQVNIVYNEGTDLYDIEFFRIRKYEIRMDAKVTDVFVEDLVSVIDAQVG